MKPDVLLRAGGILCAAWLLGVAVTMQSLAAALGSEHAAFLEAAFVVFFLLLAFESMLAQLPKRYTLHVVAAILIGVAGYVHAQAAYVAQFNNHIVANDSMALAIAAAQALLHGHNPYTADLSSAYHGLPTFAISRGEDGSVATAFPYPALLFLCYVPVLALKADPLWVGGVALAAAILVIAALAPAELKTIGVVSFLLPPLSVAAVGLGAQDILFVVPLMLAAYWWTALPFRAALCLGIACAVKTEPWFDLPIFLLGVAVASMRGERATRMGAAAAGIVAGFVVPNLYFLVAAPRAWAHGVFRPFFAPYLGGGVGLVNLSVTGVMHNSRGELGAMVAAALVIIVFVGWRWFPIVRNALWLTPGLAIFFAPRSAPSDFVYLVPVCLAAWFGATALPAPAATPPATHTRSE